MQIKHLRLKLNTPQFIGFAASLIFTVIAVLTCLFNSVFTSICPKHYLISEQQYSQIGTMHAISCTADTLYYTGYDYYVHGKVVAHYYYTLDDKTCTIFLIDNKLAGGSDSPQVTLSNVTFSANIRYNDTYMRQILEYMASDLDWNYYSLAKYTNSYIISQYHYNIPWLVAMIALTVIGVFATVYFWIAFRRETRGAAIE